jgi:hypothetical protein
MPTFTPKIDSHNSSEIPAAELLSYLLMKQDSEWFQHNLCTYSIAAGFSARTSHNAPLGTIIPTTSRFRLE